MLHDRPRLAFLFGFSTMNVGIALCVHWCVIHHAGRIGRVLNSGPLVYVGVLSYSIYLWQQIFLDRTSDALLDQFPVNLLGVIAASLVSFYVIERPSLAVRQWLERRWFVPERSIPAALPAGAPAVEARARMVITAGRPLRVGETLARGVQRDSFEVMT
jgi:peptidoglycan/LPS O-acetylase OafA/YrhL